MDRHGRGKRVSQYGNNYRRYPPPGTNPHRVLKFKHFIIMREDEISPERAGAEYARYVAEFLQKEIALYYDKYHLNAFFMEMYHPYYLNRAHEFAKAVFQERSMKFISDFKSGNYRNLLLEISAQRLYGKDAIENESNFAECACKYREWAYEIPLEFPKDDAHCDRVPIKSPLQSAVIARMPTEFFKLDLVNAVKPYLENFVVFAAEHENGRTVFFSFDEGADLVSISNKLNEAGITMGTYLIRFEPLNPLEDRVRVRICPPICSHPLIITRDVGLTRQLICKLDAEMGKEGCNFADSLPEDLDDKFRLDLHIHYLRLVHNYCYYGRVKAHDYIDLWDRAGPGHVRVDMTNDLFDKETGMAHNQVTVKYSTWESQRSNKTVTANCGMDAGVSGSVDVTASGADVAAAGDDAAANGEKDEPMDACVSWEDELKQTCEVHEGQLKWLRDVETFAQCVLNKDLTPPPFEAQGTNEIDEKWQQFCNLHTVAEGTDRFRCSWCKKLFNGAEFVFKHLLRKHGEYHEKIVVECGNAQMREIFTNAHKEARCNPYDYPVTIPVLQKPPSDFDRIAFNLDYSESSRNRDYNINGNTNINSTSSHVNNNSSNNNIHGGEGFARPGKRMGTGMDIGSSGMDEGTQHGDSTGFKRRRAYHDFDKPQVAKAVKLAPQQYSRPTVKYDDL